MQIKIEHDTQILRGKPFAGKTRDPIGDVHIMMRVYKMQEIY